MFNARIVYFADPRDAITSREQGLNGGTNTLTTEKPLDDLSILRAR
jgi:hypothetical protein